MTMLTSAHSGAAVGPGSQVDDSLDMPQFGATFYPGGVDDYLMPEVLAPLPQRVMPEVPENMQQGLQRLELEAREVGSSNNTHPGSTTSGTRQYREPSLSNVINTQAGHYGQQYQPGRPKPADYSPASNFSPFQEHDVNKQFEKSLRDMNDFPSFSPFPKVTGEHLPPSDEDKETVLADSREHVLHSNDPEMQICWARDVLSFVEIAAEAALREVEATRNSSDRELPARPVTPKIEHELRIDAINIITYLADQGHPEALFIRSKWVEFGKFGKRQDKKEAYSGYMRAAQQGWGRADYRIGMLYEHSNDVEKAMRHYQAGLANKDSAAAYRLGMINLLGQRGMPKDMARGLDLIRQAAETADEDAPQGAFVYGMLIGRDLPDVVVPEAVLPYDVARARQYIEKAAYLGFAKAQLKMGQAYELCQLGCEFIPAYSLHYYGLAARQGQPEACLGVSRWFLFGYENDFAKNEQLAFKYAQMAAKAKLATGEFAMGYYYEIGISVEKDIREARRWYELAAEHGNNDAAARLESLAQAKTLSKEDHETATLTRIKSKHGSQRGQRPDRFKQVKSSMPTVSEAQGSPRVSPQPSPRAQNFEHAEYPDPSQPNPTMGSGRQPAFSVNIADRAKSAAPYPEDDRPAPLNLGRPATAAPYPEDDIAGYKPPAGHYNPGIRPSAGPNADRPGSAFGIRTQSPAGPGGGRAHPSQLPIPPAGMDTNYARPGSAGWQPQVSSGYRQPSPGPRQQDLRPPGADYNQRPSSSQYDRPMGGLPAQPGPNRLTNMTPTGSAGRGGPLPQSGYGKRESSLPSPHAPGQRMSAGPPAMSGGAGPRVSSVPPGGLPQGGPRPGSGGRPGPGPGPGPGPSMMEQGGYSNTPPAQGRPSPAPSTPTSAAPAAPKPSKTGPATFEAMGIPQAKKDDDCVVM